jgi:hypothetical protein
MPRSVEELEETEPLLGYGSSGSRSAGSLGVEGRSSSSLEEEAGLPWADFTDPEEHDDSRYTYLIVPVPIGNVNAESKELIPNGTKVLNDNEGGLYLKHSRSRSLPIDTPGLSITSLITQEKTPKEVNVYHTEAGYIVKPKGGDKSASPKSSFSPGVHGFFKRFSVPSAAKLSSEDLLDKTEKDIYNRVKLDKKKKVEVTGLYFNAQGSSYYKENGVYKNMLKWRDKVNKPLVVLNKPRLIGFS